jgi:hypothetical protein
MTNSKPFFLFFFCSVFFQNVKSADNANLHNHARPTYAIIYPLNLPTPRVIAISMMHEKHGHAFIHVSNIEECLQAGYCFSDERAKKLFQNYKAENQNS